MKKALVMVMTAVLLSVFSISPLVAPITTVHAAAQSADSQDPTPADNQNGHSGHH